MASDIDVDALAAAIAERVAERLHADADRLLDRGELAARLGVAQRTIASMVGRHELPAPILCTGGVTRWRWNDVLAWLSSRADRQVRRGRGRWDRGRGAAKNGEGHES
jgi:predicted DNA-binding transcriptional regulator AlpA